MTKTEYVLVINYSAAESAHDLLIQMAEVVPETDPIAEHLAIARDHLSVVARMLEERLKTAVREVDDSEPAPELEVTE